jgi:hypothetical protein
MKKTTISLSDLTHQILLERRFQRLIENVESVTSSVNNDLKQLGNEIIAAGMDMSEEEVQAALLSKLLDANGNIDKVDVSDVKELEQQVHENRGRILEGGSIAMTIAHTTGDVLGNAAFLETISHGLAKITGKSDAAIKSGISKLQKLLKNVAAVAGLPGKVVERSFKWIAAKFGGGEKTQKIFGITGTLLFVIAMLIIAIVSFPHLTSFVAIALGVTALIGKFAEIVKLIKHLIHTVSEHEEEIKTTKDKTELEKKIDKWLNSPIKGASKEVGDVYKGIYSMK